MLNETLNYFLTLTLYNVIKASLEPGKRIPLITCFQYLGGSTSGVTLMNFELRIFSLTFPHYFFPY